MDLVVLLIGVLFTNLIGIILKLNNPQTDNSYFAASVVLFWILLSVFIKKRNK